MFVAIAPAVLLLALILQPFVAEAVEPELPRAHLDTTYSPPTGRTVAVPRGGDFQAALLAAQAGDVITLAAGATYRGPFTLPNKAGAGWITVRSSVPDAGFPPPGTRVTPAHAPLMPRLVASTGSAITTARGARHATLCWWITPEGMSAARSRGLILRASSSRPSPGPYCPGTA